MSPKFKGTFVAIVTPFQEDGSVDEAALKRLVEHCIAGGVDGLVPCGTTGEKSTLTAAEHQHVIGFVCETAGGRVKIIAGTGSNDTAHAAMMAKFAKSAGADAALSVTPYYNKPTQEGLFRHYSHIAEHADFPLVVYNVPGRTSLSIAPETLMRLWSDPRIAGLKDASGNVAYTMQLVAAGLPDGFSILSGDDALTVPLIALGAHGVISVAANEIPAPFAEMTRKALDGDLTGARAIQDKYLELMHTNFIETNPLPVKTALALMGLIEENFRLPLCPMMPGNKEKLAAILRRLNLIC
ncbi:4-hydroxy-tetrahydrodipicolinate synthase [Candidatus Sumerlaeota bacterium]|nr:4-hydroxy-tetrahydrodipicolinate synthase [Candidatus Sumerlaeota bacterium]